MKQIVTSSEGTQQQIALCEVYCRNGGNLDAAAQKLGIAEHVAQHFVTSQAGAKIIKRILARLLLTRLAPAAVGVLQRYVDEATPLKSLSKVQLEAAKTILDRAGIIPPRAPELKDDEKMLNELPMDELKRFVEDAQHQIARLSAHDAQTIDSEPSVMFS
jgi:hypothetical protein